MASDRRHPGHPHRWAALAVHSDDTVLFWCEMCETRVRVLRPGSRERGSAAARSGGRYPTEGAPTEEELAVSEVQLS